jgi:carboxypeptidase C (cathepsin A)
MKGSILLLASILLVVQLSLVQASKLRFMNLLTSRSDLGLAFGAQAKKEEPLRPQKEAGKFRDDSFYSGYLNVDETNQDMFYVLFESRNETTRDKDPLLIWLRGQPGCAATKDLFDNFAPYRFDRNQTDHDPADIVYNPLAWNNFTNVMFLDSPVGNGYSYLRQPENPNRVFSLD